MNILHKLARISNKIILINKISISWLLLVIVIVALTNCNRTSAKKEVPFSINIASNSVNLAGIITSPLNFNRIDHVKGSITHDNLHSIKVNDEASFHIAGGPVYSKLTGKIAINALKAMPTNFEEYSKIISGGTILIFLADYDKRKVLTLSESSKSSFSSATFSLKKDSNSATPKLNFNSEINVPKGEEFFFVLSFVDGISTYAQFLQRGREIEPDVDPAIQLLSFAQNNDYTPGFYSISNNIIVNNSSDKVNVDVDVNINNNVFDVAPTTFSSDLYPIYEYAGADNYYSTSSNIYARYMIDDSERLYFRSAISAKNHSTIYISSLKNNKLAWPNEILLPDASPSYVKFTSSGQPLKYQNIKWGQAGQDISSNSWDCVLDRRGSTDRMWNIALNGINVPLNKDRSLQIRNVCNPISNDYSLPKSAPEVFTWYVPSLIELIEFSQIGSDYYPEDIATTIKKGSSSLDFANYDLQTLRSAVTYDLESASISDYSVSTVSNSNIVNEVASPNNFIVYQNIKRGDIGTFEDKFGTLSSKVPPFDLFRFDIPAPGSPINIPEYHSKSNQFGSNLVSQIDSSIFTEFNNQITSNPDIEILTSFVDKAHTGLYKAGRISYMDFYLITKSLANKKIFLNRFRFQKDGSYEIAQVFELEFDSQRTAGNFFDKAPDTMIPNNLDDTQPIYLADQYLISGTAFSGDIYIALKDRIIYMKTPDKFGDPIYLKKTEMDFAFNSQNELVNLPQASIVDPPFLEVEHDNIPISAYSVAFDWELGTVYTTGVGNKGIVYVIGIKLSDLGGTTGKRKLNFISLEKFLNITTDKAKLFTYQPFANSQSKIFYVDNTNEKLYYATIGAAGDCQCYLVRSFNLFAKVAPSESNFSVVGSNFISYLRHPVNRNDIYLNVVTQLGANYLILLSSATMNVFGASFLPIVHPLTYSNPGELHLIQFDRQSYPTGERELAIQDAIYPYNIE